MMIEYRSAAVHRAAQFTIGNAEALCLEFNAGRDPSEGDFCFFNGWEIFVLDPSRTVRLTASPGNWLIRMPDDSLEVHADADFQQRFCPAS
jgi:hypothetical protein